MSWHKNMAKWNVSGVVTCEKSIGRTSQTVQEKNNVYTTIEYDGEGYPPEYLLKSALMRSNSLDGCGRAVDAIITNVSKQAHYGV